MHERNPLLQSFYVAVIFGAYGFFVYVGYPRLPCAYMAWPHHKLVGAGVFALCVGSWVAACTVSPGIVTAETVATFDRYPYDGIIFGPGGVCRTTGVRKIARSKYCRYMRANVARFDHFCPWLNQAVGERNYRVFLGFLLVHVALLAYGTVAAGAILRSIVRDEQAREPVPPARARALLSFGIAGDGTRGPLSRIRKTPPPPPPPPSSAPPRAAL